MAFDKQLALILAAGLAVLLAALYTKKLRLVLKTLLRSAIGFFGLVALNYTGQFIGLGLGINILNSLVLGILGLPGLCALLILRWLY